MTKLISITTFLYACMVSTLLMGQCISGDCVNGQGKYIFKNNSAIYTGSFENGLPSGQGNCEFSNGDHYIGAWKLGKFSGHGELRLSDGSLLNGQWTKGSFQGEQASNENITSDIAKAKSAGGQKIWALVVGVSDYHHMPVLRYTDDDAYQFQNHLLAADGLALPSNQVKKLINESATRQNIIKELKWLAVQADENDIILFYFSGHGLKGSFLPFDYDGFNHQLFHNEVNNLLKPAKAAHRICIADACHSGGLMAARGAEDRWLSEWYPMLVNQDADLTFFLSSKSSERSLESEGLRMGVFSHFLIKGLNGQADQNGNAQITLQELYQFVAKWVGEYTGQQQSPVLAGEYDPQLVLSNED